MGGEDDVIKEAKQKKLLCIETPVYMLAKIDFIAKKLFPYTVEKTH